MKRFIIAFAMSSLFVTPVFGQAEYNLTQTEQELIDRFETAMPYVCDSEIRYTTTEVNIREYPTIESNVLDTVSVNTEFESILDIDGWTMITYGDAFAYIKSEYLSYEKTELIPLGIFKVSHYCIEPHKHICGDGTGLTRSGNKVHVGSLSVDPRVIPLGSTVVINGQEYIADDTGGAIKGKKIDMAVASHKEAMARGVYYADVYLKLQ